MKCLALSLKQPWASLVVHGRKSIEIRRWPISHRGLLAIHAAKIDDPRPEAWAHVGAELRESTNLRGGIIGLALLTDCRSYCDPEQFAADQKSHLNAPSWFDPQGLFGFVLEGARPLPFLPAKGNVRLFGVEIEQPPPAPPPEVSRRLERLARTRGKKQEG